MKKWIILTGLFLSALAGKSQDSIQLSIMKNCDSIFVLLEHEKDDDRKAELIINFYLTSIDGFPTILLDLGQRLFELAEKRKDILIESSAWSAVAQGQRLIGNYVRSLEMHRKAVTLAEKSHNNKIISFAYNQMAHIYKDRLENEKALELYKTAFQYAEKATGRELWFPSMNLASVYLNMDELDSAMYYTQKALLYTKGQMSLSSNAIILATIASIYSKREKADSARKYFDEAVVVAATSKSPRYLNATYLFLAEHFQRFQQYDSAAAYNRLAVDVVKNTPSAYLALRSSRLLIDYYQDINPDSTVKYWKLYAAANDSLNSTRANQQIQMLTFEEEQRKRDVETENMKYRNKIRTGMLVGSLTLFSLLAIFLFRNNKQKQKTLNELKATQSQLIQSEKMASLGELTAGIVHEIQNPLNFVNNFSDVSKELLLEMKDALERGDTEDAKDIMNDVIQNLEKINHHGKRADSIVKGMLQHSRSNSGKKELTDINLLCDEFIRLSYHGLRAKDKTFNSNFESQLDNQIDKINILPQEIGRVILNLCNNAFYAVNNKKKTYDGDYKPSVILKTSLVNAGKENRSVQIEVIDNGSGIPEQIIDKIYQPFYTTKPTGEGTGLGLSMSYDIITKVHGGTLNVDSEVNVGTTFTINLPY